MQLPITETVVGYRLSPQQRRLWTLHPKSEVSWDKTQCQVSIPGSFDRVALLGALQNLVGRHEILRTTFRLLPGMSEPLQVIDDAASLCFMTQDLSHLRSEEQEREIAILFENERRVNIGVDTGPLLRVFHIQLSDREQRLLIGLPALCCDQMGMENLVEDLHREYLMCEGEIEYAEEPIQYADVSETLNEFIESNEYHRKDIGWESEELIGSTEMEAPYETSQRSKTDFDPQLICFEVKEETLVKMDELCRKQGTSRWIIFLSCWQVLFHRLTGRSKFVTGVAYEGRTHEALKGAVGLFSKYLPVPSEVDRREDIERLCVKVGRRVEMVSKWQEDFSWDRMMSVREGEPGEAYCGWSFDYYRQKEGAKCREGTFAIVKLQSCIDRYKARIVLRERADEMCAELHYDGGVITYEGAQRLAEQYVEVIESAVEDPRKAISELEVMSRGEREYLLSEVNRTDRDEPLDICIQTLFERQAERAPDAVALVYEDRRLSYGELNRRANQLAHHLRGLGVGPETPVALCLERSPEMIIGLLGTLKAGGFYVPLDPAYPPERLAYMLEDAGATLLLTHRQLSGSLSSHSAQIICLDSDWEQLRRESAANLEPLVSPQNLAYVIYTSGSTGKPKGVGIEHRQLTNYVTTVSDRLGLIECASFALVSTFAADLGNTVIFPALRNGPTLHLISEEGASDERALAEYFRRHPIDCVKITPSHLSGLLMSGGGGNLLPGQKLVLGGESSSWEWVEKLQRLKPECQIWNHYGPTECTVGATVYKVNGSLGGCVRSMVPLGQPLGNMKVYALDEGLQPMPVGVAGELYIGGAGVARGYVNQAGLTAEKFTPDPFGVEPGSLVYRTGDRVRWLADGNLEFLGRFDHQVKIRGHRVELGEIETALGQHPGVRQSAVLVREDHSGDKRLVAYVVPQNWSGALLPGRYLLPNGMAVMQQNKYETSFLYEEIFERQVYFRHGIQLSEDACVFDVGANIGLFTLFVSQQCPKARIYAFEPVAPIFESLRNNVKQSSAELKLFPIGLAEAEKTVSFAYYPRFSMMSSLSAYASSERQNIEVAKRYLYNQQQEGEQGAKELLEQADQLLDGRFLDQIQLCRLRRISDVMREEGVKHIDLLKVDVERAEMDVLQGIDQEHWEKIDQIVVEARDQMGNNGRGRVEEIVELLESHGYEVVAEQDELLTGTDMYNLYARRKGSRIEVIGAAVMGAKKADPAQPMLTASELRGYLQARLPGYMVPSAFVLLKRLPLTPNGKLDRRALPDPGTESGLVGEGHLGARTPTEEILSGVWAQVLRLERVGVEDNFFELGGHSLLATQVISRAREAFQVDVPLRALFEAPTVAGLAAWVEQARLERTITEAPPMRAANREGRLPLSFAQQRLWFLDQLEPGSATYNIPFAVRLNGRLQVAALRRSLSEIVRRHEVLRTCFPARDGEPAQKILSPDPVPLPVIDLGALAEGTREATARRLAEEEARRPFDLSRGPLLRVGLLRLGEEDHALLVTMHHIVSDGWSLGILVREFTTLYQAYSEERESPLEELRLQYADFACWQREWLRGDVLEEQLSYWRRQLAGAPTLELATDRPRPAAASHRGASVPVAVSTELTEKLKALSRQEGVTLFMTLLAAFQVALSRYARQPDVVVGTDVANRNRIETEGLIGFFVNQLVLRTNVGAAQDFRELLRQVREVTLGAYAHQDLPFEKLVEELAPERSLNRSPLFQVMIVLRNAPGEELKLPRLQLGGIASTHEVSMFDMTLALRETRAGLTGALEYATDLFEADTIERLARHTVVVLERIASNLQQRLSELTLLTEDEQRQMLVEWNDTQRPLPSLSAEYY